MEQLQYKKPSNSNLAIEIIPIWQEWFKLKLPHTLALIAHSEHSFTLLIIHKKKLLDSDKLREVQFKRNTSVKSVTPVQKV